jgi:hypothetical protein
MKTIYRTYVNGELFYEGKSLEDAVRTWDRETYRLGKSVPGGIAVASYLDDLQMRDGWILHVMDNGVVYLNPQMS